MQAPTLNPTNMKILAALAQDGRMTYSALAESLGYSINTVRDRVLSMERRGIISGYEAVVAEASVGNGLHVLALLAYVGRAGGPPTVEELAGLAADPAVRRAYRASGRHALVLELVGPDYASLHEAVQRVAGPVGYGNAVLVPLGLRVRTPQAGPERATLVHREESVMVAA